jgi:hypothetical protein
LRGRVRVIAGAVLAAASAPCAPAAIASGGTSPWISVEANQICGRHGRVVRSCRTLAANERVRVFRASDRRGYNIVFGEWRPRRRLIELEFGPTRITAIKLAREVLAYAVSEPGETGTMVYVIDMRRGEGAGWIGADDIEAGSPGVSDLALTPGGTVAWLVEGRFQDPAEPTSGPHPLSRAVYAVPAHHDEPVLLAYGTGIRPGSLTAAPGRVEWFQDGSQRTFAAH